MNGQIEVKNIEYKNQHFVKAKWFVYEILINDDDKYVNISKLLNIINEEHRKNGKPIKEFRECIRYEDFKEYCEFLNEKVLRGNSHEAKLYYKIHGNQYNNHISGTYIHEDLLNYVLMWADKKYAIKINRILKELNNNNIKEVNQLVEDFKNQNSKLVNIVKDLSQKTIYEQSNELTNNSKIKLYKLKDSDIYKLSYDQEKDFSKDLYELKEVFIVNSASNILKSEGIKQFYNKGIRQFDKENYDFIIDYIKPSLKMNSQN